jgi:hypothetical protein
MLGGTEEFTGLIEVDADVQFGSEQCKAQIPVQNGIDVPHAGRMFIISL